MPLFMDVHNLDGPVTAEDVAKAHAADLGVQDSHGVHYLRYWVDEEPGQDLLPGRRSRRRSSQHRAPRGARPGCRRDPPRRRRRLTPGSSGRTRRCVRPDVGPELPVGRRC